MKSRFRPKQYVDLKTLGLELKPIPGFKKYMVSKCGEVIALPCEWRKRTIKMRPKLNKQGYYIISLTKQDGSRRKFFFVHRLVCLAFKGPCPDGMVVNHLDGNPINNHLSNLEYVTQKQNIAHAIHALKKDRSGENHWGAKLTNKQVLKIRKLLKSGYSQRELGRMFNLHFTTIGYIKRRKHWDHI